MGNCYGGNQVPIPPGYTYGLPPASYPYASAPIIDADPITPGIQSTPGVVTPVGPPRVAGYPAGIAPPIPSLAPVGSIGPIGTTTTYQTNVTNVGLINPNSGIGIGIPL